MKKTIHIFLAVFTTLMMAAACAKETVYTTDGLNADTQNSEKAPDELPAGGQPSGDGTMTLRFTLPEPTVLADGSKISLTQDDESADGAVKLAWEEGDVIWLIDHADANKKACFEIAEITDAHNATFAGTLLEGVEYYDILYGASSVAEAEAMSYATQTQAGNASTAHLKYTALLSNVTLPSSEEAISFTSAYASVHGGGTFRHTGILRFRLLLPTDVASISSVTLTAPSAIFYTSNALEAMTDKLTINFSGNVDVSATHILAAYAALPWADRTIAADTDLTVTFYTPDQDVYHKAFAAGGLTLATGMVNPVKLECNAPGTNVTLDDFAGGSGVDGDPYLIANPRQMGKVHATLAAKVASSTTHFKLIDNIDLSGYANWAPIDASEKFIHFEGNNKTISNLKITGPTGSGNQAYSGLFAILYGTVQNLTIDQASVAGCTKASGILAGYLCSASGNAIGCTIDNVKITASSIDGNNVYCGALAGLAGSHNSSSFAINISDIDISGTEVTSANSCGGLLGSTQGSSSQNRTLAIDGANIINSKVSTTGESKYVGGLIGVVDAQNATISNIDLKGTNVSGLIKAKAVGGIFGLVSSAVTVDACTYEKNGTTTATVTGPTQHDGEASTAGSFIGGIAGEVSGNAQFYACHVKNATITFTNPADNTTYWKYVGGAYGYVHAASAVIGSSAKRCSVESCTVNASHFSGGFIGYLDGGVITYSDITDLTTGGYASRNYFGGFAGYVNAGTISDSSVAGSAIQAGQRLGGFAGFAHGGTFEHDMASIPVGTSSGKVNQHVGGFVGEVDAACTFANCSASGSVYSSDKGVGGFVGANTGGSARFTDCSATPANLTGTSDVGGFCGEMGSGVNFTGDFIGCSVGSAGAQLTIQAAGAQVGGFVGWIGSNTYASNTGTISKCHVENVKIANSGAYTAGFAGVSKTDISCSWTKDITIENTRNSDGGFVGYLSNATVSDCYAQNITLDIDNNKVGGFVGNLQNATAKVLRSYVANVTITSPYTYGGFIGDQVGTTDKCIMWVDGMDFKASGNGANTDHYDAGTASGSVSSHAQESPRSWSSDIWDFTGDLPVLR